MLELLSRPETYISLLSLTLLEIVLGIDNIIFISILTDKLSPNQRPKARIYGLSLAVIGRIGLLLSLSWLISLKQPFLYIFEYSLSGKDLVMLAGGLFLIAKSSFEIYDKVEGEENHGSSKAANSFASAMIQIMLIDLVFSLDSIITAVGLVNEIPIMMTAIVISVGIMILSAGHISDFINAHPSVKVLALSFLLMIGTMLVAEAFHYEIPKGYIYFSLAFALLVELINIKVRQKKITQN
ncbi:MAG: TerC family protein [Candidatus Caenarcaniphilales bacterium]|nr:TerC family protein [Candidatus Caenarcaniphilales bacterium]